MKYVVPAFINFYQRFISPYKGFRCAHAVYYGGDSCSTAVKKLVLAQGCINAYPAINARFAACRKANQKIREKTDGSTCSKVLEIGSEGIDLLTSCDAWSCEIGACDCSF